MPLTAADVEAKQFSSSGLGRRGYDEAEVDDFLDEVQTELTRLHTDNADLRTRLEAAQRELSALRQAGAGGDAEVVRAPAAEAEATPPQVQPGVPPAEAAARVLALAERTAEQFVAEARSEATRLLAEARSRSEQMSREAEERERRALGELDRDRSVLDRQVDELRAFEREYRSRLRAYLEDQLQQLDTSPDVAPALPPGVAAALDAQPSRGLPPGNEPPGPVPADGSTPPHEPG